MIYAGFFSKFISVLTAVALIWAAVMGVILFVRWIIQKIRIRKDEKKLEKIENDVLDEK